MDVVIDYRFALKLINAESKRKLKGMVGQVHSYKKAYKDSAVILVNTGKMERPELLEIAADYEKLGVRSVIFNVSYSWNQRENQVEWFLVEIFSSGSDGKLFRLFKEDLVDLYGNTTEEGFSNYFTLEIDK